MKNEYTLFRYIGLRGLNTLSHLLNKAKEHSVSSGISESEIVNARLAPDMFPFKRQVQVFTDGIKGGVSRYAEIENPKYEDNEETLDELIERVDKTRNFVESVSEDKFVNAENIKVKMPWMPEGMYFSSKAFAQDFAIQNNLFHLSMAYAILRNLGVQIGKMDYLGNIEMSKE